MKVEDETIHQLVLTRDIHGLYKACMALRRELDAKNDLIEQYSAEIRRLEIGAQRFSEKYEVFESERNLLRRVCRRLEVICAQNNMKDEYEAAWQEYDLSTTSKD